MHCSLMHLKQICFKIMVDTKIRREESKVFNLVSVIIETSRETTTKEKGQ